MEGKNVGFRTINMLKPLSFKKTVIEKGRKLRILPLCFLSP